MHCVVVHVNVFGAREAAQRRAERGHTSARAAQQSNDSHSEHRSRLGCTHIQPEEQWDDKRAAESREQRAAEQRRAQAGTVEIDVVVRWL